MSLDKEKDEKVKRIEVNLRGKPSIHRIQYRENKYDIDGHSDKQAKMILSLKGRKLYEDWNGVKNEMKKMKTVKRDK